ncbi:hypothetical protein [Embleya scabrispora]|uniref:hypothetical protein n=1 Tax=Embleya scabrispora TaxID=159449 RepID=UPI001374ECEB|nr:hypothetical protein [Embleya scabrispora]
MVISTTFTHTWRSGAATMLAAYPKRIRWLIVTLPVFLPLLAILTEEGFAR